MRNVFAVFSIVEDPTVLSSIMFVVDVILKTSLRIQSPPSTPFLMFYILPLSVVPMNLLLAKNRCLD